LKKPITAALLTIAAVATLAVPAGAASSKDWTRQEIPCRVGHKSAVVAWSPTHPYWLDNPDGSGNGIVNPNGWRPWFSNPCKGQWLLFTTWSGYASEDSTTFVSAQPGTSGRIDGSANGGMLGRLADAPSCDVQGGSYSIIERKGQPPFYCP
jgi:hypothetical protein